MGQKAFCPIFMGLLYRLLHQGYTLRNKAPKGPSRIARLMGTKPTPNYRGAHLSLDFLFPVSTDSDATRSNYVAKTATLQFFVDYLPSFFFFRIHNPGPKVLLAPLSFRQFKQNYAGLEDLELNPCLLDAPAKSLDWDTDTQSLFRYLFVEKYFVSTYAVVCLSAQHERSVSPLVYTYALLIALANFDFTEAAPQVRFINSDLSEDFISALCASQTIELIQPVRQPQPCVLPPLTEAALQARQPALGQCLAEDEYASDDSDETEEFDSTPSLTATDHVAFHRYTLAGQGLDNSLATPVRGFLNKLYNKGRTPRNKQIYRTGVF